MDSRKYSMYMLFFPIPEDVFYSMYSFFTDSGRCFWGRNYRFCILCIPSGLNKYIYIIYTRVFAHICTTWRGKHSNCWNAGKNNFKGNRSICGNAGRRQFQGGSIPTAECLCKKQLEGGSIQTAERLVKKQFQGESILIAEMLVEKQFQGRNILTAEKLVKNNFKGETF